MKAIEAASMKAIEVASMKAIKAASMKAIEAASMKAIEVASIKAIKAALMMAIKAVSPKGVYWRSFFGTNSPTPMDSSNMHVISSTPMDFHGNLIVLI